MHNLQEKHQQAVGKNESRQVGSQQKKWPEQFKREDKRARVKAFKVQLSLFMGTLCFVFLVGLMFPLRPLESQVEKRKLTEFPAFNLTDFINGRFFQQVSTWYADSFPFRESLIKLDAGIKSLYGFNSQKIVANVKGKADAIPTGLADQEILEKADKKSTLTEKVDLAKNQGEKGEKNKSEETQTSEPDGAIHDTPQLAGNVYVAGDTAFNLFYFNEDTANAYIKMLDSAQKASKNLQIYSLLIPTSVGVNLDPAAQQKIGSSDQQAAFDYVNKSINKINPLVKTVDAFTSLKNHNSEYIYFRTDHHWTQLGAYYVYCEWARVKGVQPVELKELTHQVFDNFVGSLYANSNQAASLLKNPDHVDTYRVSSTNAMTFINKDQETVDWNIITDVSEWNESSKYNAFIAGDEAFSILDNPSINNGENVILIKDSYGNALAPLLMANYDKVFVVDYRYFYKVEKYQNQILKLAEENNVRDVIILNNADGLSNPFVPEQITSMFGG